MVVCFLFLLGDSVGQKQQGLAKQPRLVLNLNQFCYVNFLSTEVGTTIMAYKVPAIQNNQVMTEKELEATAKCATNSREA